jgi:hypothetical protein
MSSVVIRVVEMIEAARGISMGQQPHEIVATLATAGYAARCIHVVADLGVADIIGEEAVPAAELATSCGVDAGALERVLRLLAAHGVFERRDGGFGHTPASRLLHSGHPRSMRAYARMMGLPLAWGSLTALAHSVRTGAPGLEVVEPKGLWAYLQNHPEDAQIFGKAMTAKAGARHRRRPRRVRLQRGQEDRRHRWRPRASPEGRPRQSSWCRGRAVRSAERHQERRL